MHGTSAHWVSIRPYLWLIGLLCPAVFSVLADEVIPPGPFEDAECISCHTERNPELLRQWRQDPHSTALGTGCSTCHGDRHRGAAETARRDQSCTGCHAGPVSHSYATSKHGVITRLESNRRDWRLPLQGDNYRTPGCSYCHYYDASHRNTMDPAAGPGEVREWICTKCHSPRYTNEQFAAGQRQLEIADLKVTEGLALIASVRNGKPEKLATLEKALTHHRRNVLLGVGHQSPDYQWWHGQPALDGDLIRIRDVLVRFRERSVE